MLKNAGWNASVPPNGFINRPKSIASNDNPDGLATSTDGIEIETTPEHMNLVSGDPACSDWTRKHDDENVSSLREYLRKYQGLHSDNMWSELPDPVSAVTMRDVPVPVLTINFPMIDLTFENGPIRQIPGTQRSRTPIPNLVDEPEWMKLSTVCPAPAGTAIFRDIRAWHGGTPNLSLDVRAMPNVEYYAPWFRSEGIMRCMPYAQWENLSPHAQRISRLVVCDKGEPVIGAGFMDPRRKKREAFKQQQLNKLGEKGAQEYLARL